MATCTHVPSFPDVGTKGWGTGRQSGSTDRAAALASSRWATSLLGDPGQVSRHTANIKVIMADKMITEFGQN